LAVISENMEIFKNTEYPKKSKDLRGNEEEFSVDVISCDVHGMMNLCYWNYDMNIWMFHTDTLSDPYEGGKLIEFVWMYKPTELCVSKCTLMH